MRKGDDLTTFTVSKVMKNPEALTFRIPKSLFRPVAGKLYLYLVSCSYVYLLNTRNEWSSKLDVHYFNENIQSTFPYIHCLHPPPHVSIQATDHPLQYALAAHTSSAPINRYKLQTSVKSNLVHRSVLVFSEYSTITLQLPERMAYQRHARLQRLPAVSLQNDGLQTDSSIT